MRKYHVYIMSNVSRTLYIGMTGDLEQRVFQHKQKVIDGFTAKYNVTQLVWFDEFDDVHQAIEGQKKLKGWRRSRKIDLIELTNPDWKDLAADWFDNRERPKGAAD